MALLIHDPSQVDPPKPPRAPYTESYWQQGCDDGKAGRPRREPGQPGIADMENIGYMNGWHFGHQQRLKQQDAPGVALPDGAQQ